MYVCVCVCVCVYVCACVIESVSADCKIESHRRRRVKEVKQACSGWRLPAKIQQEHMIMAQNYLKPSNAQRFQSGRYFLVHCNIFPKTRSRFRSH
jgi:hypothetical protein